MAYGCFDTSIEATGAFFVEISFTDRRVSLVVYDDDLSYTSIMLGPVGTNIGIPNGTLISHPKKTNTLWRVKLLTLHRAGM